jgi:hypothetical protein
MIETASIRLQGGFLFKYLQNVCLLKLTERRITQTGLITLNVFLTKKYSLEIDKNKYFYSTT